MSKKKKKLFYLVLDAEFDGPYLENSLIAIAFVFGPADGSWPRSSLISFYAALHPLPDHVEDQDTMDSFWVLVIY
jgi:hypothetical protein